MQWFCYIIGKKLTKCANVLPVLPNIFLFSGNCFMSVYFFTIFTSSRNQYLLIFVKKPIYYSFSGLWIKSYANRIDKQYCINKIWKFGFGRLVRILDYYWRKQDYEWLRLLHMNMRIRYLLRNFSIILPIILLTNHLPVYHICDISNCRKLSFNPLMGFQFYLDILVAVIVYAF